MTCTLSHITVRWLGLGLAVTSLQASTGMAAFQPPVVHQVVVEEGTPTTADRVAKTDVASIERLISQLGAPRFRDRQQAETELESLGIAVYESLLARINDPDIEIRLRATRLVKRLQASFLIERVDPALRPILANYGERDADYRELVIQQLEELLPQQAIAELTRIARFESNERLAKLAALSILGHAYPPPTDVAEFIGQIRNSAGNGDRAGILWLRWFADILEAKSTDSIATWDAWIADEEALLQQQAGEVTSRRIVQLLRRLKADVLALQGQFEEASISRRALHQDRMVDMGQAIAWMDWLLQRSDWESIIDFGEHQSHLFEHDARLLYGLAEARLKLESASDAESASDLEQLLARSRQATLPNDDRQRHEIAMYLDDDRGLFDWAEWEYLQLIEQAGHDSLYRANAFLRLAGMYHSIHRHQAAADILDRMLQEVESDPLTRKTVVDTLEVKVGPTTARMHYYRSLQYQEAGDVEQQRQALQQAFAADADESDVLIAMYRLQVDDPQWQQMVREAIQDATDRLRLVIQRRRREAEVSSAESVARSQRQLATSLNHLAWLVSNTEGDYEEALRFSHQSLEIRPGDAGLLDTLARCYFSLGELEKALHYQRWAVQRRPHDGQIQWQLEFFRGHLEAR